MSINGNRDLIADRFAHRLDYRFHFFAVGKTKSGSRRIEWCEFQSTPTRFNALYSRLRPRFWRASANPAVNLYLVSVLSAYQLIHRYV